MEVAGSYVIQSGEPRLANRWLGATPDMEPPNVILRAQAQPADVWVVTPLADRSMVKIIHQRSGLCLARNPKNFTVCIVEPTTTEQQESRRQVWTLELAPQQAPQPAPGLGTYTVSSLMDDRAFVTPGPDPSPSDFGVSALPASPSNWIFVQVKA